MKLKYYIILLLLYPFAAFSQKKESEPSKKDTVITSSCNQKENNKSESRLSKKDSLKVYYFYDNSIDSSSNYNVIKVDTNLHGFEKYDPILIYNEFNASLGNIGLASRNVVFTPEIFCGFDQGVHSFDGYMYQNERVKYYSSVSPFTKLGYSMGSKKEQIFSVLHSHNIKKLLTIAVDFKVINSPGRYRFQQQSNNKNAVFTAYFNTKNKRYGLLANYIYNNINVQENGGITNDTLYEDYRAGLADTSSSYYLKGAQSIIIDNGFYFKNFVNLFSTPAKADSTDSVATQNKKFDLGRLTYTFRFHKLVLRYNDNSVNLDYYKNVYINSLAAQDETYNISFENSIYWSNSEFNTKGNARKLRISAGAKYDYIEVHSMDSTTFLNLITPFAKVKYNFMGDHVLNLNFQYLIDNVKNDNYKADFSITKHIGKAERDFGQTYLKASYSVQNPSYIYNYYYSDFFCWKNEYKNQTILSANIGYQYKKLDFGVKYYRINDYLYFNSDALPEQSSDRTLSVTSIYLKKNFDFGIFGWDNSLVYQYSENDLVNVPAFVGSQTYYFKHDFFKNALYAELGFDLNYNTLYFADGYMPATKEFFTQSSKEVGNYLYIDVFLNFKIKRAFFFLKLQHANSGLMGYNYYTTPHYPGQDRLFRFGVSWKFYN